MFQQFPKLQPQHNVCSYINKNITKKPKHQNQSSQIKPIVPTYHQEKSLKELILKKTKHTIIQKVQSQLMAKLNFKIIDKNLFQLACYINHYQSLYSIIASGIKNTNFSIQRPKGQQSNYNFQLQNQKLNISSQRLNLKSPIHNELFSQSFRHKCLKEFFQISMFKQNKIVNTIVNKIQQKVKKCQIKLIDNIVSTRRISIMNHRRGNSDQIQNKENLLLTIKKKQEKNKKNKQKIQNLQNTCLLPKLNINVSILKCSESLTKRQFRNQTVPFNINNNKLFEISPKNTQTSQRNKNKKSELIVIQQKSLISPKIKLEKIKKLQPTINLSPSLTLKSFKAESRRNGIHQVNKILQEMKQLKMKLKNQNCQGYEVMKIASSLKGRLDKLLCNLKVKNLTKNQ